MDASEHGEDLQKFVDYRPTQFDAAGLGSEGQEDWRVLPVIQTRDSGPLDCSNFEAAQKLLDDAEAEYEIHRFGHWGPGWFEIIVVEPTATGLRIAGEIACALADYPILDEMDLGERELEDACESWDAWGCSEAIDTLVNAHDLSDDSEALLIESSEVLWSYQMDNAGFESDDSGATFPTDHWTRMTRDDVAALLRECRKAQREE